MHYVFLGLLALMVLGGALNASLYKLFPEGTRGKSTAGIQKTKEAGFYCGFGQRFTLCVRSLRWWVPALGLACFCCNGPNVAYAIETQMLIDNNPVFTHGSNDVQQGYMLVADNKYIAACYLLGVDYANLTEDQKALLSNEETGGAFYSFVQSFVMASTQPSPQFSSAEFTSMAIEVFGPEYVYWVVTNIVQKSAARIAYEAVLNGDVSGGDGAGISSSFVMQSNYPYNDIRIGGIRYKNYATLTGEYPTISTINVNIGPNVTTAINNYVSQGYSVYAGFETYQDGYYVNIRLVKNLSVEYNTRNNISYISRLLGEEGLYFYTSSSNYNPYFRVLCDLTIENNIGYLQYRNDIEPILYNRNWTSSSVSHYWSSIVEFTTAPETNWPDDEPSEPRDEPVVPDPPENDPYDRGIDLPEPGDDPYPVYDPETEPTYTTPDLTAVLDAMAQHCRHLQKAIHDGFANLWNLLDDELGDMVVELCTYMGECFEYLGTHVTTLCNGLMDYMHDLAVWLAEQFRWAVSGGDYDDSTVVSWLKKIWAKLGSGDVNSRPTDPVARPDEWWRWLENLWGNFVINLLALGQDLLAELADGLHTLITKFPFSIPWDLAAMLGLLVAPPVAPVVEVPFYTVDASGGLVTTWETVDLSVYSDYLEPIRFMEKLVFAGLLASRTKGFMELFKIGKGVKS